MKLIFFIVERICVKIGGIDLKPSNVFLMSVGSGFLRDVEPKSKCKVNRLHQQEYTIGV